MIKNKLNIGIVGGCGRGASFKAANDALGELTVHAVCDVNQQQVQVARQHACRAAGML